MTAVYILLNLFWRWLDWIETPQIGSHGPSSSASARFVAPNLSAPTKGSSKNLRRPAPRGRPLGFVNVGG
jgi:hypothetical protein